MIGGAIEPTREGSASVLRGSGLEDTTLSSFVGKKRQRTICSSMFVYARSDFVVETYNSLYTRPLSGSVVTREQVDHQP